MDFETFQSFVAQTRQRYPMWFTLDSDPLATDAQIETVSRLLNVKLPDAYCDFVRTFGGGEFALGNVFSVAPESDWYVVTRNKSGAADFLAVSDDFTGGVYGFRIFDSICTEAIYYCDLAVEPGIVPTEFTDLFHFLSGTALNA